MPRLPVDGKKVVEHRITFGTKERELAEGALAAYQFNRVGTPIVASLSDVSFLVFVGGVLAAYKIIDSKTWNSLTGGALEAATTTAESISGLINAFEAALTVAQERRDSLVALPGEAAGTIGEGIGWVDNLLSDIRRGFRSRQFMP